MGAPDHSELGVPTQNIEEERRVQTIIKWGETHKNEMNLKFCLNAACVEDLLRCSRGRPIIASKVSKRVAPKKRKGKVVEDRLGARQERPGLQSQGAVMARAAFTDANSLVEARSLPLKVVRP